jgi:glycine/D-amino acid oxidase-like deaminating enzyme
MTAAETATNLPATADVVVVGGGVVGIACARELALRGASVVVLERDRVGYGCSFGNAGWLTPSQALPLANPNLLLKSFAWLLDPESLYIQPRLDPAFLRWLRPAARARTSSAARRLLELCRVSVDLWEELARRNAEPFVRAPHCSPSTSQVARRHRAPGQNGIRRAVERRQVRSATRRGRRQVGASSIPTTPLTPRRARPGGRSGCGGALLCEHGLFGFSPNGSGRDGW